MKYQIQYSDEARTDLITIHSYISTILQAPDAANHQIRKFLKVINFLKTTPLMYARHKRKPLFEKGIRYIPVGNYNILYYVNVETHMVSILRIFYCGMDDSKQFNETFDNMKL
jgi:toxin ParE1/3/4